MKKKALGLFMAAVLGTGVLAGCSGASGNDAASTETAGTTAAEAVSEAAESTAEAESTAAAGTTGEDSAERIQLELWDWWGDEQYGPVIEKLCSDFNASQDKYEVVHVNYPWGDVWTKALAATAAGDPPDIIIQDIRTVTHRAQAKQATELTDLVEAEGEGFMDQFYPQLADAMMYDGGIYGLPFVTDTRILYYDKDAFEEVGLDPEAPPQTWDELVEYARKLDVQNEL